MRAERVLAMIAAGGLCGCTGQPASPVSDGTEAPVAAVSAEWAAISGTYEVVAVRRASLTAAPLDPDSDNSDLLGEVVTLDPAGITSPGGECVPDGLRPLALTAMPAAATRSHTDVMYSHTDVMHSHKDVMH